MSKFSEEKEDPKKSKIRADLVSSCQHRLVFLLAIWYAGLASSKLGAEFQLGNSSDSNTSQVNSKSE